MRPGAEDDSPQACAFRRAELLDALDGMAFDRHYPRPVVPAGVRRGARRVTVYVSRPCPHCACRVSTWASSPSPSPRP